MRSSIKVWVILAGLISFGAQAGLVQSDWKEDGDGQAVLHQETGLEWLTFNNTFGMDVDTIFDNDTFEGWRAPTSDEVITLINEALPDKDLLSEPYSSSTQYDKTREDDQHLSVIDNWSSLFGYYELRNDNYQFERKKYLGHASYAVSFNEMTGKTNLTGFFTTEIASPDGSIEYDDRLFIEYGEYNFPIGHIAVFLVREANDVPSGTVPGALFGLLLCAALTRRLYRVK